MNFKEANKITREELLLSREQKLKEWWSKVGSIKVQCYHCGFIQNATTVRTKKCVYCNKSFTIVGTRGKVLKNNAIIHCPENNEKRQYILWIIELTFGGRISQIL